MVQGCHGHLVCAALSEEAEQLWGLHGNLLRLEAVRHLTRELSLEIVSIWVAVLNVKYFPEVPRKPITLRQFQAELS